MEKSSKKTNSVGKAVAILETLRTARRAMSVKELSDVMEINKSSLHHHLRTLTDVGYLQQDPESRKYDVGLNLVRTGQSYLQRLDIRERGHSLLEQLSRKLNETVHMLVLDCNEVVYVDKVDIQHQSGALQCSSFVGLRTDVYSTASGKVLLSHLELKELDALLENLNIQAKTPHTLTDLAAFENELRLTKERGYGLDLQEHTLGLQCIAVPVLNSQSKCVAAVSVSCPKASVSRETLVGDVLDSLQETGLSISAAMGFQTGHTATLY